MAEHETQWLVVTDLDGTLMNHDSYAIGDAVTTIQALHAKNIPVVLNTSKTCAETIAIQQTLGINDPFIVENGACVYLPRKAFPDKPDNAVPREDYWAISTGKSKQEIGRILDTIDLPDDDCTRLTRCSVEQVMELTGLSRTQAEQALQREYTEPIIWHANEASLEILKTRLKRYNVTTLQGGRFLHIQGNCDKGEALKTLSACYRGEVKTIVLGDSANDAAMLAVADIPIIVKSPANPQLEKIIQPVIKSTRLAPEGWTEAIDKALNMISSKQEQQ